MSRTTSPIAAALRSVSRRHSPQLSQASRRYYATPSLGGQQQQQQQKLQTPPSSLQQPPSKRVPLLGPNPVKSLPTSASPRLLGYEQCKKPDTTPILEASKQDLEDAEKHGIMKPPPPGASWPRRLAHKAIELFKFYFRGVKLIFAHRKTVKEIRHRIRNGGPPMTRAEFRFIQVYSQDIQKLIPFMIIVLIVEEIVPLIAIYAPFMLPSTCILPSQRERIHSKKQVKALSYIAEFKHTFRQLAHRTAEPTPFSTSRILLPDGPTSICGKVPVLILRLSTLGPDFLRLRRIQHHLRFIAEDDHLLMNEGMGVKLNPTELRSALEERGLIFTEESLADQRKRLGWWLQSISKSRDGEDNVSTRLRCMLRNLASAS